MQAKLPLPIFLGLALCVSRVWSAPQQSPFPATPPTVVKVIVSDVIIQGNRQTPAEHIKNLMSTLPGKEYTPDKLQEDVRNLFATRQFANVWADIHPDGRAKIKVFVYVREYPNLVLKVTYQGNLSLTQDELDQTANIRKGAPLNPSANKLACLAIVRRYNEEGRPYASCRLLKGSNPADIEVIFSIAEGPKVKVHGIAFTGNTFVNSAVLRNRIDTSATILGLGGAYNSAVADNDVHQLIKYYRSFGYHDVKVNRELVYIGDAREVRLIFHIEEGVRYRVAEAPRVTGVNSEPAKMLEGISTMKAGEYFDENKINKDTNRIKDYFGYRGHNVQADALPVFSPTQPGLVRVTYRVVEK